VPQVALTTAAYDYSSRKRHTALMSSERGKYLKFGGARRSF